MENSPKPHRAVANAIAFKTVLVVDDSEHTRRVIRLALESLTNFRICGEAANGLEAIYQASQQHPDLIVMDLAMPVMNGVEAAMELRSAVPRIPIILLSMYGEQLRDSVSPCYGITRVVSKADGVAGLVREIRSLFPSAIPEEAEAVTEQLVLRRIAPP